MVSRIILLCEKGEGQGSWAVRQSLVKAMFLVLIWHRGVLVVFEDGVLKRRSANAERRSEHIHRTVTNGERIEFIYCSGPRHYVVEIDHFLISKLKTCCYETAICVFWYGVGAIRQNHYKPEQYGDGTGSLRVRVFKYIELILLANRTVRLNRNLVVCYLFVVLHFQSNNEYSCKHQLILLQYTRLNLNHLKFKVNPSTNPIHFFFEIFRSWALMNMDITGALFTLKIKYEYTKSREGASDVNIHWRSPITSDLGSKTEIWVGNLHRLESATISTYSGIWSSVILVRFKSTFSNWRTGFLLVGSLFHSIRTIN